jgi:hypothetical protein
VAIFKSVDPAAGNILSQVFNNKTGTTSITAGIFQFESGVVINEGTTLALKSAIEGAVVELIKEGASRGVWDYRIDIPAPAASAPKDKVADSVSLPESAPVKTDVSADVAARTGVVK